MLFTLVLFIIFCPTYLANELCAFPSCRWLDYISLEETPAGVTSENLTSTKAFQHFSPRFDAEKLTELVEKVQVRVF